MTDDDFVDESFAAAYRALEAAMDDLATATIRAQNIEFPDVDLGASEPDADPGRTGDDIADLQRWATDEKARNAEFQRRVAEAIDDELESGVLTMTAERKADIIENVRAHMRAQLRRFGDF